MPVQWKTVLSLATFCITLNYVTSSILIDPVPQDFKVSFSDDNTTAVNPESTDIQPRKRDVSTLITSTTAERQKTGNTEEVDRSHFRTVRAIRAGGGLRGGFGRGGFGRGGFGRGGFGRGGFGRGGLRAWGGRGRYNPYWGGRYNSYWGWGGGYGYYPYYYGGWPYGRRQRYWPRRRPAIIIG
ncbi:unnamed protein product [Orchesella dallaii]|uniref:Uncharacterized protein n=1 Tax=Orchesella dallaii TaxID=48710 RepID=A0ABP1PT30_9HEXA